MNLFFGVEKDVSMLALTVLGATALLRKSMAAPRSFSDITVSI